MAVKTPRKVKVTIKCGKSLCTVHPSVVLVHPGGTVLFDNKTNDAVHVQVAGIGRPFKFKKTYSLKIPATKWLGIYPYAVFCNECAAFCEGSSMPIIIVPRN